MTAGTLARVSNPRRGTVIGTILETTTPDRLPSLPSHGFDELKTETVRVLLAQWKVKQLALITYRWTGPAGTRDLCFFAIEIDGSWYDLKRQPLTIEPIQAN